MTQESVFGEDYFKWVSEHSGDDPDRLRLAFHSDERPWIKYAITHVASLRRADKKFQTVTGESMSPSVIASELALQQSTSADIALLHASILAEHVACGADVLDMTCGLGTDSRALSRFFNVTACEVNPLHATMARENFRDIGNVEIIETDSVNYLGTVAPGRFKAIFIDPARRDNIGRRVYGIRDCTPDLIEIYPTLRATGAVVMCKLSPMIDISQTLADLKGVSEVHVIGDGRDCKELVVVIDPLLQMLESCDVPVSLWTSSCRCDFRFTISSESTAKPLPFAMPAVGDTLWIPSAVAMKGGCFNLLSKVFGISPVSSNTHVYVSDQADLSGFPGHGEQITDVIQWKSSELKRLKRLKLKACARVRNFGMTASQLAEKLGLGAGSDSVMITGITLADGSRLLIQSSRM